MEIDWLIYLIMPFVAGVIGYFTNWVAIWMLFRPHQEKRILGIKLPLTPGLIPARRVEMAEKLGKSISTYLINEASLRERLDGPEIRTQIHIALGNAMTELLAKDLGSINSLVPSHFQDEWNQFILVAKSKIEHEIRNLLKSPTTEALLKEMLNEKMREWRSMPIEDLIPKQLQHELPDQIVSYVENLTHEDSFESKLEDFIDHAWERFRHSDNALVEYVPDSVQHSIYEKISLVMPIMTDNLLKALDDHDLKRRIKIELYDLVQKILSENFDEKSRWDKFRFGLMETFLISVEEIQEKIDSTVENAGQNLAQFVQSPDIQEKINVAVADGIGAILQKRISEFNLNSESAQQLKQRVITEILTLLRSNSTKQQLRDSIVEKLDSLTSQNVDEVLSPSLTTDLQSLVADHMLEAIQSDSTSESISAAICEKAEAYLDQPIGKLQDRVSTDLLEKGQVWISDRAIEILKDQTPKILNAVDVESLVRDQVNKLPLPEVERLILGITNRQLKAITWFGALLGFTIGLLQVVILIASGGLG